ncbi:FYVE zinc finger-domain-containing protein [Gloeopeniophorella convolvens]|nr:FYVE zinc finger-domain-containing protein [Gloeopeniophorella convolvens]
MPANAPSPSLLGSLDAALRSRESLASSASLPRSPASSASLPSLTDAGSSSSSCSSLASLSTQTPAPNEHLAVLLPRSLWKQDADASYCDIFVCRKPFSIMERRHHCRKCGGIFCAACSARKTPLLDTTTLPFFYPPRGTTIASYASPSSLVLPARVCDGCYDQIHGTPMPRSPPLPAAPAPASTLPRSRAPRRAQTLPPAPPPPDPSLPDDLRSYPLRIRSDICKATGGGRWMPKPSPIPDAMKRVPGRKAPYEIALEQEEEAARRARLNPVIRDGDFQYRPPRPHMPSAPERPLEFSTF